jgi:hypothetical protein
MTLVLEGLFIVPTLIGIGLALATLPALWHERRP